MSFRFSTITTPRPTPTAWPAQSMDQADRRRAPDSAGAARRKALALHGIEERAQPLKVVRVDQVNPGVVEDFPRGLAIGNRPESDQALLRVGLFDEHFQLGRVL